MYPPVQDAGPSEVPTSISTSIEPSECILLESAADPVDIEAAQMELPSRSPEQTQPAALAQLNWMASAEEDAEIDELNQLYEETSGLLEKLAEGFLKLGSCQLVLWQPRFVFATPEGLKYQKVSMDQIPIGKPKLIKFGNIKRIEELEFGEFTLYCKKREYTFKAADEQQCQMLVSNLKQLIERHRTQGMLQGLT